MFTGIIEETGTISDIRKTGQSIRIGIRTNITFSDLKPGDSLCVNGVCLTVTEMLNNKTVFADVTPETYSRTNFSICSFSFNNPIKYWLDLKFFAKITSPDVFLSSL